MSQKSDRRLRRTFKKMEGYAINDFVHMIIKQPFMFRLKFCWLIIMKREGK